MHKIFLFAFLFLTTAAFFPNFSPAQTRESERRTINAQAVAFVGNRENSATETENRPRLVSESNKTTAFEMERKILGLINEQRA